MLVDADSGIPLHAQIALILREQIRTGQLPPGEQLPAEPELALDFRVARETVARALRMLKDEGLITRRRGVGSVVVAATGPRVVEIGPGRRVSARLPAVAERDRLGVPPFYPVLVVETEGGGPVDLYDAATVVLSTVPGPRAGEATGQDTGNVHPEGE